MRTKMTKLLCLLAFFVLPLMAVDVTITAGPQSETFTVTAEHIAALTALRDGVRDPDTLNCPPIEGEIQDCSTTMKYVVWKIKQLMNHGGENHPQGQDVADLAAIAVLKAGIVVRKVK